MKKILSSLALSSLICTTAFANDVTVTGLADVYGDGEKVSTAVLTYSKTIDPKSVDFNDFSVDGKTIETIIIRNQQITLKFAYENTSFDGVLSQRSKPDKSEDQPQKPKSNDAPMRSDRKVPELSLSVQQVGEISATDGTTYQPWNESIVTTEISSPIIESFQQFTYTDENGLSMPYNLYLPKNYDSNKKYPLLFFVADASANINEVTTPLFQGNGATVFATDAEQSKHECIVLAPQYTADLVDKIGMMTTDENVWTDGLTLITKLLNNVIDNYSVDKSRIYGTGQSQGGMTNIAISDKYPDLFAAQFLVACQWNVDEMEVLKDKNLWILVCEGDTKAFPEMNKAVDRWESLGSKIARNNEFWNSKASIEELNQKAKTLADEGANINYTVFSGGNHMYTWSFAYNIDFIHDWLFSQIK